MLKVFSKFKPLDWVLMVVLVGITVGQVYFDVNLPRYSAALFNRMLGAYATTYLWRAGGRMMLFALGSLGANFVGALIAAYLAAQLGRQIRKDIFDKVQSFGLEEMNTFSTASLITRSTNDITQVETLAIMMLRVVFAAPIMAVWSIVRIHDASFQLTMLTGITIAGLALVMALMCVFILPKFKVIQKLTDSLNSVTRQNLTGLRVVKAYNAEQFEQDKLNSVNEGLNRNNVFANSIMGLILPILMLVMNGINLAIFWLGASLINSGTLSFPDLMEFSGLIMQVLMAFIMISMLLVMVPRAQVSAKRIFEVLKTDARVTDPTQSVQFDDALKGVIEFDNVSFAYPGAEHNVLSGISFTANKGQTVAFIGSTGSGKSTLVNLVPRFYDVSEGVVRVAGKDVRQVTQHDLRARIGYVPQKGVLFGGTIEGNIGYGVAHVTQEKLQEAAQVAKAADFIESLDEGYQAKVSQGGKNFSGGQRQRMSIARAVAIKPEIFIFDDSFSALDYKTDKEVRAKLKQQTQGATCLIVAQRIGTIMDADMIVVLEKGEVVGRGTHKELLNSCEVYKEIALSQLTEEELA